MSRISVKFLVLMVALLAAGGGVGVYWNYTTVHKELVSVTERQTALALAFDLAIRRYVADEIRPAMEKRVAPGEFIPEAMSTSFIARSIFEKVRRDFPDLVVKFSSDNPRNPVNQAGPDELRIIRYFAENPQIKEWSGEVRVNGRPHFAHFAVRRMEESCLRCHGRPEDAPASLVQRYGSTAGFHRPVGDIVALDSVAIPADKVRSAALSAMTRHAALEGARLVMLLLAVTLLFHFLVGRRLRRIKVRCECIAAQPDCTAVTSVEAPGRDEIAALARSFNVMVERVRATHGSLERQIANRTKEMAAANEELQKLASVVRYSSELVNLAALDGRMIFLNDAGGRILGIEPTEVDRYVMLDIIPESCLARFQNEVLPALMAGGTWKGELQYRNVRTGELTDVHAVMFATQDPDTGAALYLANVSLDITERKRAEAELRQAAAVLRSKNQELEAQQNQLRAQQIELLEANRALEAAKTVSESANRAKSGFLANMSHEIRTPMNGIIGLTELALATDSPYERREYLNTVLDCATSLLRLLNDILDLSKIEAGRLELDVTDFDVIDTVENVAAILTQRASAKRLELVCNIDPAVPRLLRGDPVRLRQVLVNLAGNAVKFTEEGEVVIGLRLEHETAGEVRLRFWVSDTGIGIPRNRLEAVFETFAQVDGATTRKYGGTGLGLAISKQIVELLGGTISVESEPGKGSVFAFQVTLERAKPPRDAALPDLPSRPMELAQRHILVVDDSATSRLVLEATLKSWGCTAALAGSGSEALEMAKAARDRGTPFEVVLLDTQMPNVDGLEVARAMREDPAHGYPEVVLLNSLGERRRAETHGCSEHIACLAKPVRQAQLLETLLAALAQNPPAETEAPPPTGGICRETCSTRVLVVEDNPVNRQIVIAMLRNLGCAVGAAENGRGAIETLEREPFDLVLMDLQMPEMDGLEATRELRRRGRYKDLPVIALTAYAMKDDRARCLDAGMDDFIAKPLSAETLSRTVFKWRKGRRSGIGQQESSGADHEPHPAPAALAPPEADPVRIEEALSNLDGDLGLLEDALQAFVHDLPSIFEDIRAAITARDGQQLAAAARSINETASHLCAEPISQAAQQLEAIGEGRDWPEAEQVLSDLEERFAGLRAFVQTLRGL